MFLYFSFACQMMLTTQASETSLVNGGPSSQQNIFTALVYGFSLLVNVWAFYRISGGLFNPAVRILESVQCQTRPDFLTKY
jgi:aquaporin related protein